MRAAVGKRLIMLGVGLIVVVAGGAGAFWLWLDGYAPFAEGSFAGPAPGSRGRIVQVEPATGSGGKTVWFPLVGRSGTMDVGFSLANRGRFSVDVLDIEGDIYHFVPVRVQAVGRCCAFEELSSLDSRHPLKISPHREGTVLVRYRIGVCAHGQPRHPERGSGSSVTTDLVRVRFRVLGLERTQVVELPMALTLVCDEAGTRTLSRP